jgi:hypothetical protein
MTWPRRKSSKKFPLLFFDISDLLSGRRLQLFDCLGERHQTLGGKVILSGWDGGYGYAVRIDHGDGLVTVYGHNSKLSVKVGDEVKAGDTIALAGNTGHSFGVHCHLEIRVNDVPQNPINFFKERGVDFFLETESVYGTG